MCYICILLMLGYTFGSGDHTETLSLLTHRANPDLFPNDLYIQSMLSKDIHERWLFVELLYLGNGFIEKWALILHALFSMILIAGVYKVNTLFLTSRFFKWISIFITFVLLNNYHLGGNELYYNAFLPSLPAKALGVWSIYYFLRYKFTWSALLLLLSAAFQPLVAAQLLILHSVTFLIYRYTWGKTEKTTIHFSWAGVIFLLLLITYLVWLYIYHTGGGSINNIAYREIYEFRSPHHYFPDYFSLKSYIVYGLLSAVVLYWSYLRSKVIFTWVSVLMFGCVIYYLMLEAGMSLPLLTQWFKSTIWLEMLGVMAVLALANEKLMMRINMTLFFFILLALLILILYFRWPPLQDKPYEFDKRWMENPQVKIALAAGELTSSDAVFIIPPDQTTFRQVSQRSVYVDFKSIAHNRSYLQKWAERINQVYGLEAGHSTYKGFEAIAPAKDFYTQLTGEDLIELNQQGVTHMLTVEEHQLPFEVVARSQAYIIYQILPSKGNSQ